MSSHNSVTHMEDEETPIFTQPQAREPTTPQSSDILQEIRSANAQFSARLDGFNLRLGDMERQHRVNSNHPDSPSPQPRDLPSSRAQPTEAIQGTQDEALPASITLQRGPHRTRADAAVPPHMARTAAALAASSVTPPSRPASASPGGSKPLDRYRSMTKGEKSNVKRALASLGLTVPILMDMFKSGDDESMASTLGDDEQTPSSASPTVQSSGATFVTAVPQNSSNIASATTAAAIPTTVSATAHVTSSTSVPDASVTQPPVVTPERHIDPAPNIAVTSSSPAAVTVSTRTMTCKTEWIGDYDGDPTQLEDFLTRLRDLIRSETQEELILPWTKAVLRTLPRTLKGNAAIWHQGLSDTDAAQLTSLDAWCEAMRSAFPVNRQQLKRDAWTRKWKPTEETAMSYYFHKVRLLRQTFGKDASEDTLVNDIKDGLPENMVALLRLPRKGATLSELVTELGDWEPNWRKQHKVPLLTSATTITIPSGAVTPTAYHTQAPTFTPAIARVLQPTMGRSASAPTTPAAITSSRAAPSGHTGSKPMSKFAAAYDPTRIIPAQNGQPRRYRPPGKDTVMDLKSPCSYCGGDHFNFEHDHIVPQVRTIAAEDDDYEEYPWDGQTEEDGEGGNADPSLSLEPGLAPSMFPAEASHEMKSTSESIDDTNHETASPGLFFADKAIFSISRTLRPNEAAPPLAQEKRAFGRVVPLSRSSATGTGLGYRNHVPLTTHVRVNDTDGRAMSSLLDTGASLSCIDATLLKKMGGTPRGDPINVHGVGSSKTLGWVTLPLFISAQDPHGKHIQLEAE